MRVQVTLYRDERGRYAIKVHTFIGTRGSFIILDPAQVAADRRGLRKAVGDAARAMAIRIIMQIEESHHDETEAERLAVDAWDQLMVEWASSDGSLKEMTRERTSDDSHI